MLFIQFNKADSDSKKPPIERASNVVICAY
nr:MAG TPA: hypothetical protein [Bacteriophage sp.]